MAGQRVDYSGAAHGLCRDPAYEGASDGAADQQEAPKCRAGICSNDAGRFVQAGACEDTTCTGAADAVDEPQAPTTETARHRMRPTWHASQLRTQSRRRGYWKIRSTDPRTGHGLSQARANRRATNDRPT